MKKSIRMKLFFGISLLIVFFVLLSWLLNTQYLSKYYTYQKKMNLTKSSNTIKQIYKGNTDDISLELERLERTASLQITILDENKYVKYDSYSRTPGSPNNMLVPPRNNNDKQRRDTSQILRSKSNISKIKQGNNIFETSKDPRLKTEFLESASLLWNGDFLLLTTPLAQIKESAEIANRFFLFTGVLTIIVGGIAAFVFSRRFTGPILELNSIARKMSKLDFSTKYNVKTNDEIGMLGSSINLLSDQLDNSISELKDANEKLTQDIEHERRIDELRKEFISNVSHELKTPISLIQGYAEGLKSNVNEDEENKNFYCSVIMDETNKMNKLVRELLDLSQIESGYLKLETDIFDMSTLVEQVLEKYSPIFREKGINLLVEKEENLYVNADSIRIEQVLTNYLNNAIDHVDNKKTIKIKLNAINSKLRLSVFNTGEAIPKEFLDKIWLSFYKIDKARTREFGGTGLGLSIVKAILDLHDSAYGVVNQDEGVEFWFELDREISRMM